MDYENCDKDMILDESLSPSVLRANWSFHLDLDVLGNVYGGEYIGVCVFIRGETDHYGIEYWNVVPTSPFLEISFD